MEKILSKFDEAKAIANSAVSELKKKQELLNIRDGLLQEKEAELAKREVAVKQGEKEIEAARKLLKTQNELDYLISEAQQRLQAIENQEKERRAAFVKKQNELEIKEAELLEKKKELDASFARLKEKENNFKKQIVDEMTKKIFKEG